MGIRRPMDWVPKNSFLTFVRYTKDNKFGRSVAMYQCVCGAMKEVYMNLVKRGSTKSCGKCGIFEKGNKTHGFYNHPLFKVYGGMMGRCHSVTNDNYKSYGAKGVKVCEEWRNNRESFFKWALANGWQKGLQLDKDKIATELGLPPNLYSPEKVLELPALSSAYKCNV